MKFLENSKLEALNSALSVEAGDCRLDVRIESYSCKMVQSDKRLFKGMLQAEGPGTSPHDPQPLSPPVLTAEHPWTYAQGLSPGGSSRLRNTSGGSDADSSSDSSPVWCDSISRKMLFDLVTLLNLSFPDYDFTGAKGENFRKVATLQTAVRAIDSKLAPEVPNYHQLKQQAWQIVDEEIQIKECALYSYNPDYSSDPFSEDGCVWSFNYFFYNKRLKRILFFSCRALRTPSAEEDEQMWSLEDG